MFERFTDRARKVMALANQEGMRAGHEYIGTEHILLGLVKDGSGVGANVLKNLGVDLHELQQQVEKYIKAGPGGSVALKLPQTPRAKKVLEYAIYEARNLNHNYVGTEHLLLGLLREEDGVAAQVLISLGVKLEDVREEVLNLLGAGPENEEARSTASAGAANTVEVAGKLEKLLLECANEFDSNIQLLSSAKDAAVKDADYERAKQLREQLLAAINAKYAVLTKSLKGLAASAGGGADSTPKLTPARFVLALIEATPELARKLAPVIGALRDVSRDE